MANNNYPTSPHFAIPFKIGIVGHGTPTALVTEQDSSEEIMDCVEVILRYEQGYRIEKPTFGVPDQTFAEPGPDPIRMNEAISQWEPRAETVITAKPDEFDVLISRIKVEV